MGIPISLCLGGVPEKEKGRVYKLACVAFVVVLHTPFLPAALVPVSAPVLVLVLLLVDHKSLAGLA